MLHLEKYGTSQQTHSHRFDVAFVQISATADVGFPFW